MKWKSSHLLRLLTERHTGEEAASDAEGDVSPKSIFLGRGRNFYCFKLTASGRALKPLSRSPLFQRLFEPLRTTQLIFMECHPFEFACLPLAFILRAFLMLAI